MSVTRGLSRRAFLRLTASAGAGAALAACWPAGPGDEATEPRPTEERRRSPQETPATAGLPTDRPAASEAMPGAEVPEAGDGMDGGGALPPDRPALLEETAVAEKPATPNGRAEVKVKTRSLYGFSPRLAPFVGKTPTEQVALLREWGCTVVFGGYQDAEFVEAAHAAGMKVFAEFGCFVGADWWERVPSSRPVTAEGKLLEREGWYYGVNPAIPQVRQARLEALGSLLTDHAIDGVWLDFIRWPCHWEVHHPRLPRTSFDADTLALFSRDTGIEVASVEAAGVHAVARALLEQHQAEWTAWRCQQINSWVAQAEALLRRIRPDGILGLFGVPWRLADYDRAILSVVGQDYRALGRHVDVFSPMVYHLMCGRPPGWIGEVTEEVHALSGKPVWPIIQSIDEPTTLSAEEYAEALHVALDSPASEGVLVFTLEGALSEAKLAVTRDAFWRDEGE